MRRTDPVHMSLERMERNLHKLKQIGPFGNANSLWETAGHIWGSAYWICELTKDAKIMNDAWAIRLALSHIISKTRPSDQFEHAIQKISESYKNIQERVPY